MIMMLAGRLHTFISIEEEAADSADSMETKYTDIIIYVCGFLALVMATIIVVLCRMQVQPRGEPFDALPVQKLSKFPLRRQVRVAASNRPVRTTHPPQTPALSELKSTSLFFSIHWSPTHRGSPARL